ncbi:hypothetical protein [Streptomyces chartreusis]|uniref:Uncharacterized protein n=1 Tax=Streptomyces chartreusis TaxID=1969 RepID=A0A7H8TC05_STRCX|nr:hypothetical protein [Streptomyces chartreusis]QKZ21051.1 hypothetical protein HUT05_29110 [Streptomyces chartreusis]
MLWLREKDPGRRHDSSAKLRQDDPSTVRFTTHAPGEADLNARLTATVTMIATLTCLPLPV